MVIDFSNSTNAAHSISPCPDNILPLITLKYAVQCTYTSTESANFPG